MAWLLLAILVLMPLVAASIAVLFADYIISALML